MRAGEMARGRRMTNIPYWESVHAGDMRSMSTDTPSPTIGTVTIDTTGNETSDKGIDDVGKIDRSVDESSPLKRSDIGNDQAVDWLLMMTYDSKSDLRKVIPEFPRV
jgi:hypothetical protein